MDALNPYTAFLTRILEGDLSSLAWEQKQWHWQHFCYNWLSAWGLGPKDPNSFYVSLNSYYEQVFGCPQSLGITQWLQSQEQTFKPVPCPLGIAVKVLEPWTFERVAKSVWRQDFGILWPKLRLSILNESFDRPFSFWGGLDKMEIGVHTFQTYDLVEAGSWAHECAHMLLCYQQTHLPTLWEGECFALQVEKDFLTPYSQGLNLWEWRYGNHSLDHFYKEMLFFKSHDPKQNIPFSIAIPFLGGVYAFIKTRLK